MYNAGSRGIANRRRLKNAAGLFLHEIRAKAAKITVTAKLKINLGSKTEVMG
jgi:hypothetical protein